MKNLANLSANAGPFVSAAALGATFILAACATPTAPISTETSVRYAQPQVELEEQVGFLSCVPYARSISGVQIFGDAWTWWKGADGKYPKGQAPHKGSVLTLQKTKALPLGHVAVVVATSQDSRKLWVDHANWGDNGDTRGKVHKRQPVIDVSKANDWSEVRFMNTLGSFGRVYPAHGFIYKDAPNLAPQPTTPPSGKPLPTTRTASANNSKN